METEAAHVFVAVRVGVGQHELGDRLLDHCSAVLIGQQVRDFPVLKMPRPFILRMARLCFTKGAKAGSPSAFQHSAARWVQRLPIDQLVHDIEQVHHDRRPNVAAAHARVVKADGFVAAHVA